jgi:hypothetical protein
MPPPPCTTATPSGARSARSTPRSTQAAGSMKTATSSPRLSGSRRAAWVVARAFTRT